MGNVFQLIVNRLNYSPFSEHDLVCGAHEHVLHVVLYLSNELDAVKKQKFKQLLAKITFVSAKLSFYFFDERLMSKTAGGVRNVSPGGKAHRNRIAEVAAMRENGKYSSVKMADKGTGYVAIENSSAKHKPEELEAAMHLANKGYKVILGNEAGNARVKEGKLFLSTYEQRTPDGTKNDAANITNALRHGRDKGADIAVIYMKHGKHSRGTVEQGIRNFESSSKYRFKEIIVITKDGRLHHHKHDS